VRVLVTGASGMLGSTLVQVWKDHHEVFATGGSSVDIGVPYRVHDLRQDCAPLVEWAKPEVIVHCAALTKVDACEADPEGAIDVNGRSMARLVAATNHKVIYISSDAVLGDAPRPATEKSAPQPLSAYARSKLEGEKYARANRDCIVRTTVVGKNLSPSRQSFAEWIVRSIRAKKNITLFEDVWFSPIAAPDLARELEWIAQNPTPTLFNVAGPRATKYAFGMALAAALSLDTSTARAGSIHSANLQARRVEDQTLDSSAYEWYSKRRLPDLPQTIATLKRELED
jgi:dTDP-4-dehydrorhamnose reductase